MSQLVNVILNRGETDRIRTGHPWIYEGAIDRLTRPAEDGEVVQIKDCKNRFLGIGLYNSQSRIRVRFLSRGRRPIDREFFRERIGAALAIRQRHMPTATSFRVVNSESDFLSGVIVDKYEDVLVLQISSLGMDQRKADIVAVLQELLSPKAIVERSDMASRKFEGLEESNGLVAGELDGVIAAKFNGLSFEVDVQAGHKTGAYLDQQANYQQVADLIGRHPKARVLDCFTFQGGFAIHAARAGAEKVVAIDQSADALAAAKRNADANDLSGNCQFFTDNVFDWLKAHTGKDRKEENRFDCIILDPPSFTRNRKSVGDALRGYKEIHVRAMKLLKPGGMLATFCCSHHVDADLFHTVVLEAGFDTRATLRRIATFAQSPDHPIIPAIAETEYLKGFAFELV
jgi:23S rRNA (cytosine1962-C5)-methyltransferase